MKKCDIIFYDNVSSSYTSSTPYKKGVGASALEAIFALEYLAQRKTVVAFTATPSETKEGGVQWRNYKCCQNYKCDTLIVFRYSTIPQIKYKKLIVWLEDAAPQYHKHLFPALAKPNTTLVVLSEWHRSLFLGVNKSVIINSSLPHWVFNYNTPKDKNKFIYASANVKGLKDTIKYWMKLKENPKFIEAQLYVCTPGYDRTDVKMLQKAGVTFLGSLTFNQVVKEISSSIAMLYVNTFPETFGVSPYLAEVLGCRTHILCTQGYGALKELLNSSLVTNNVEKFMKEVIDGYLNGGYTQVATPFINEIELKKWDTLVCPTNMCLRNYPHGKEGLRTLVSQIPEDGTIVEIGSYIGESTEIMAKHFKYVYAVDPWQNGYDTKDPSSSKYPMELVEKTFDDRMMEYSNVIKIKMDSQSASTKFVDKSIDFVYIDGNHQYGPICKDIQCWLPKLRENGMIGGHDFSCLPQVRQAIKDSFYDPIETYSDGSWLVRFPHKQKRSSRDV